MNILEDLKYRGLIYQITDEKELQKRLLKPITLYCGFDPTGESLHVGHLLQILVLKRFHQAGHKLIAIAGGGTALIGDPSGKDKERPMQTKDTIDKNFKKISKQLKKLLPGAKVVNNYDWLGKIKVIDYLRDIGKNFPINYMLAKETVKSRLEAGISFTEFNYMILQSIDFLELNQRYNCELQIGGSDQWGNITAGVDLARRTSEAALFGITFPLITKADGSKFGKTESGAVWLDPQRTSPYEFYQFWINTPDSEVIKYIKYFTFLDKNEIERLDKLVKESPAKREAQKILAQQVTKLVHGSKAVVETEKISAALFSGEIKNLDQTQIESAFSHVPSFNNSGQERELTDLLVAAGVSSSKRQAREDIINGAISLNGEKITEAKRKINSSDFLYKKYLIIRRGKKNYTLIKW